MDQYTKQEILNFQKIAQLDFIPFVVGYFSGQRFFHKKLLPIGRPELLTDYTIELLKQLLPKAVWFQLAKLGWCKKHYICKQKSLIGRLWQSVANHNQVLHFSDYAIELLLYLFNDTSLTNEKKPIHREFTVSSKSNGDLVLAFLIYSHWRDQGLLTRAKKKIFRHNFLCQLSAPYEIEHHTIVNFDNDVDYNSVCAMIPWFNDYWCQSWLSSETNRWQADGRFVEYSQRQNAILNTWFEFLIKTENYAYLDVFMQFYAVWQQSEITQIEQICAALFADMRLNDRQKVLAQLQPHFNLVNKIYQLHKQFVAVHPVERNANMNCFLADFGRRNFSDVYQRWTDLKNKLIPVIQ